MSETPAVTQTGREELITQRQPRARIAVPEIAERLQLGRMAVYSMLEQGIIPAIRLGRRWIVTRYSYERWERTCGNRDCQELAGNRSALKRERPSQLNVDD